MFRHLIRLSFSLLIVSAFCSCASSNRMLRLTPNENKKDVRFDDTTINLWPFFYRNGEFYSVLWPLLDSDKKGFAARPFFNQEEREYSIMFPLCAWNPSNGDGWFLNSYWSKHNFGTAPLYNIGNKFNYALLFYWFDDEEKTAGVFPFVRSSKNFSYYGPVWWDSSGKNTEGGFFPLFYQNGSDNGYAFPLYLYDNRKDEDLILPLFGLLGVYRDSRRSVDYHYQILNAFKTGDENFSNHSILPLYYYQNDNEIRTLISPISAYTWNGKSGKTEFLDVAGPLFIMDNPEDGKSFSSVIWPLYIQSETPESKSLGSVPLFWYKYDKITDSESLNMMGAIYHSTCNSSEKFRTVMWPLYIQSETPDAKAVGSIPFFWHKYDKKQNKKWLDIMGPFYYSESSETENYNAVAWPFYISSESPESSTNASIPFFWYNRDKTKDQTDLNIMGPFYYSSEGKNESYRTAMWPFCIQSDTTDTSAFGSIPFFWYKENKKKNKSWLDIMGPLYYRSTDKSGSFNSFVWPIAEYEAKINNPDGWHFWPLLSYRNAWPSVINYDKGNFNLMGPLLFRHTWKQRPPSDELMDSFYQSGTYDNYFVSPLFYWTDENYGEKSIPNNKTHPLDSEITEPNRMTSKRTLRYFLFQECGTKYYNTWKDDSDKKTLSALTEDLRSLQWKNRSYESFRKNPPKDGKAQKQMNEISSEREKLRNSIASSLEKLNIENDPPENDIENKKLLSLLSEKFGTSKESLLFGFPLLFDYESFGDDFKWNILFFLTRHSQLGENERFRIMEYVYRYKRTGDVTHRTIFPFISTSSAPDKYKFSFLWRVYDIRREKGQSSGHIFFIPFGTPSDTDIE